MKKTFLIPLASLALCACTALGAASTAVGLATGAADAAGVAAPVTYANHTTIDEKAGISIELAYNTWYRLLELAIDTGFVKPANAARVAALDNKAYAATLVAQRAYLAGNATSFRAAEAEARAAIKEAMGLIGKGT
jgi:hypothetical protein